MSDQLSDTAYTRRIAIYGLLPVSEYYNQQLNKCRQLLATSEGVLTFVDNLNRADELLADKFKSNELHMVSDLSELIRAVQTAFDERYPPVAAKYSRATVTVVGASK